MQVSNRITRLVLIVLAVLALAAPAANAVPPAPDRQPAERVIVQPPVVPSIDNGFDWASAAIGAGLAGGIILLVGWGGITYRRRHEHIGVAR
jgi:hypothetical protein